MEATAGRGSLLVIGLALGIALTALVGDALAGELSLSPLIALCGLTARQERSDAPGAE